MKCTLIATTIMGFEAVLRRECEALGFKNISVFDTKVEFEATLADICKANLWLRTAGRVYVKIGQFHATTFDELFEKTTTLPWGDWIQKNDQFPITQVTSRKSKLFSKSDSQAIVKKAIAKQLQTAHKVTSLAETESLFPIRLLIENDMVTLSIDTSGTGLNKRGYRAHIGKAPLRETLAAGLIYLSRWRPDKDSLIDPFCGSGTICIEAALMAKNIAPGLNRSFNSQHWATLPKTTWDNAKKEAKSYINHDQSFEIIGSDISQKALQIARENTKIAGLKPLTYECKPLSKCTSAGAYGKIITNPPYGERLNDIEKSEAIYKEMGQIFHKHFPNWSYYILTPSEEFESLFKQKSTKHRKLYNGGLKCWYYQYFKRPHHP